MTLTDVIGYTAAILVFTTFYTKKMVPLRTFAIASNIAFISYGWLADLPPIILLHSAMLPINCLRLNQALSMYRQQTATGRLGNLTGGRLALHTIFSLRRFVCLAALRRVLDLWRSRIRARRELAMMDRHDFGDLTQPPGLLRDERRRPPWQAYGPECCEVGVARQDREAGSAMEG
ncbi:MAG TPA: hypothetical protein VMF86_15750 [Stellaceae bacterium]|nr:hypothetical protein [Stellaceae bacterium]